METYDEILKLSHSHPIILYDGICKFCNVWVNFIIKRDDERKFRFLPLQSVKGKAIMKNLGNKENEMNTVILLKDGKVYQKSDVSFEIFNNLSPIYKLMNVFKIIPKKIRDHIYDFIASVRYKIFGKYDKCEIPDDRIRDLFLDI